VILLELTMPAMSHFNPCADVTPSLQGKSPGTPHAVTIAMGWIKRAHVTGYSAVQCCQDPPLCEPHGHPMVMFGAMAGQFH
jgi:hypothetical protein